MSSTLCTGVGHQEDRLELELRHPDGKELRPLLPGDDLRLHLVGSRQCIGYRAPGSGSLQPCPDEVRDLSANQCPECFTRAAILPCLRCEGDRCRNLPRREECVQPANHAVYLASFGPGMLKVGVARWPRRRTRLVEQGARAAVVIARLDGRVARGLESQIKRMIGTMGHETIPDRRSATDKLRGLARPGTPETLQVELDEVLARLRLRVSLPLLPSAEVVSLPALAHVPETVQMMPLDPDCKLSGRIEAVCGQLLIVSLDTGRTVAIEAGALVGFNLRELADAEGGEGQISLFG